MGAWGGEEGREGRSGRGEKKGRAEENLREGIVEMKKDREESKERDL